MRLAAMIILVGSCAFAGDVAVTLPSPAASARAGEVAGVVEGREVRFQAQKPLTPEISMADGTRLVGVDMSWYASAPSKPAEPLSDDDRKQIEEILTVPSFYDKVRIVAVEGNADRATALMDLLRDRDFHAGKGEVIWRAELWYFEFQNGGWTKVSQQNRLLDRQRFASAADYRAYVSKLRFVPRLGRLVPATQPATIRIQTGDLISPP